MSAVAHAELQVKEVLSPRGFMYMVTVMDNRPEDILQLLSNEDIEGGYLLLSGVCHQAISCLLAEVLAFLSYIISCSIPTIIWWAEEARGSGKKSAARADDRESDAGKVILERAADEEALRILCCWRRDGRDAEVHH